MRSIQLWFLPLLFGANLGCGGGYGTHVEPAKTSPVGGAMVRLPHNAGLVAIKTESPQPTRGGKAKQRSSKIVAVFFQNDGSTPMSPPPTEVAFEVENLRSKTAETKPVALEVDPATPHRFVSAAGSFPGGVSGKIRAKIDGQEIEEFFSAR